jgi:hypothetical protein
MASSLVGGLNKMATQSTSLHLAPQIFSVLVSQFSAIPGSRFDESNTVVLNKSTQ